MMPFHPAFRRLLRRYLPEIRAEDLERHESLIALRHQLFIEKELFDQIGSPPVGTRTDLRRLASEQAARIFSRSEAVPAGPARFDSIQQLFAARQELALRQGHFLQIPSSADGWKAWLGSLLNYYGVWLRTVPFLESFRLRFYRRWVFVIVGMLLVALAAYFGLSRVDRLE